MLTSFSLEQLLLIMIVVLAIQVLLYNIQYTTSGDKNWIGQDSLDNYYIPYIGYLKIFISMIIQLILLKLML